MTHWSEKHLSAGGAHTADCAAFCEHVLAQEFDIRLTLPQRAAGIRGRDAQIACARAEVAEKIDFPREGDAVLMRALGRKGLGHHLGIYAAPAGRACVLHCMREQPPALSEIGKLAALGLEVAGYYRWRVPADAYADLHCATAGEVSEPGLHCATAGEDSASSLHAPPRAFESRAAATLQSAFAGAHAEAADA